MALILNLVLALFFGTSWEKKCNRSTVCEMVFFWGHEDGFFLVHFLRSFFFENFKNSPQKKSVLFLLKKGKCANPATVNPMPT